MTEVEIKKEEITAKKNFYISCFVCKQIIMYSKVGHQKTMCVSCFRDIENKHLLWVDWKNEYSSPIELMWRAIEQNIQFKEEFEKQGVWSKIKKETVDMVLFTFFLDKGWSNNENREEERTNLIVWLEKTDSEIANTVKELLKEIITTQKQPEITTIKRDGYQDEIYFKIDFNGNSIKVDQLRFATFNADKSPALTIFVKREKEGAGQRQIHAKLEDIENISINIKKETNLEEFR